MIFFWLLNRKDILKKLEGFLFEGGRNGCAIIKGFFLSNFLIMFFLSFVLGIKSALLFEPYFLYLYSIAYMHFNAHPKDTSDLENLRVKLIALFFFVLSILVYIANNQSDPLYSSSIFCLSPFLVASFFMKKNESICFLYRTAFFILAFFISTTIFLHFFIIGTLSLWLGKLYFFAKYDLKYPSFYINYDKSK